MLYTIYAIRLCCMCSLFIKSCEEAPLWCLMTWNILITSKIYPWVKDLTHLDRWVKFNPRINPGLALTRLWTTQLHPGLKFNPGISHFNPGIALSRFWTTVPRGLELPQITCRTVYRIVYVIVLIINKIIIQFHVAISYSCSLVRFM